MNEMKKIINLLFTLLTDFLILVVWIVLSWLVHKYLLTWLFIEGVQLYKLLAVEVLIDVSTFYKIFKFLFFNSNSQNRNRPWWYS